MAGVAHVDGTIEGDLQVWWAPLFGLIIVRAWDAESDAVLARLLGVVWILPCASHLACSTSIAAWRGTLRGHFKRAKS